MSFGLLLIAVSLVSDTAGEFMDERRLQVWVKPEAPAHPSSGLYFFCNRKKLVVGIAVGAGRDVESPVLLKWGFDDEAMRQQIVHRAPDAFGVYIPAWWELLELAVSADRLVVQVADERAMRFDLADARSDLENFTWQCGA